MDEPQQELSDSELVQTCLEGRTGAYDALVARHYRGIYNVIYRIVGNAEDASDLTQETFLRAYAKLGTFDPSKSFLAWIRRIATNQGIDHLRRRRTSDVSLDGQMESGLQYADTDRTQAPAEAVEMAEDSQRVLAAVQQLPAKQRAVLVLRHVEGLKLEEIATTLGLPLGTVKTLLFRGRKAIRATVGEL